MMLMGIKQITLRFTFTLLLTDFESFASPPARITIDAAAPGHEIPRTLWGVFFEDINLSADGGIYPELVKNRSFEDGTKPESWEFNSSNGKSAATIVTPADSVNRSIVPLNSVNHRSLCIKADGAFALENEGYWGMNIVQGNHYTLKVAARATDGFNAPLVTKLVSADRGKVLASGELKGFSDEWAYYAAELTGGATDSKARLVLSAEGKGTLFLDMVSLMPNRTWTNH